MSLLTSERISALAVELLRRQLVLAATVSRVPGSEYSGPSGGVVTLRVPKPRTALQQGTPGADITTSGIDETPVNVTVEHWYDAAIVTDEDLSLNLEDFGRQVLAPQTAAVAEAGEQQLADAMNGLTAHATIEWAAAADPAADKATVLEIREALTVNKVPAGGRYVAVAPNIATRLLNVPGFVEADKRGDASALEDAVIGQVYGLSFVESAAIATGTAVAYHSSAFGFGSLSPVAPPGGVDSSAVSEGGVALRHVLAYDAGKLSTLSVVSTFTGAAVVDEADDSIKRAIKVATASS
jgi:hypothetical protein